MCLPALLSLVAAHIFTTQFTSTNEDFSFKWEKSRRGRGGCENLQSNSSSFSVLKGTVVSYF